MPPLVRCKGRGCKCWIHVSVGDGLCARCRAKAGDGGEGRVENAR